MFRSSASIAALCLAALLSTCGGFTISLAPLLTARLGPSPRGGNHVADFSAPTLPVAVPSSAESSKSKPRVGESATVKPSAGGFDFGYDDVRMISGCKSECLELVYARSMDRGFVSA